MSQFHANEARTPLAALIVCAVLVAAFALLAWLSFQTKTPTIDEPLHAVGAYFHVFERDYRINPEDPPLWNYLAMLPHRRGELKPDPDTELWGLALHDVAHQFPITTRLLSEVPGNDGSQFVDRSRCMMLLVGVALAISMATWSWRLAGPAAAIAALLLFALDPTVLAHSPLVKNDLSLTLLLFLLAWVCWSVGRRASWWNLLLVAVICGAAVTTKFSGVLLGPILVVMLLVRACLPVDWPFLGASLRTRWSRLAGGAGICALAAVVSYGMVWGVYGFRFDPTPIKGSRLNMPLELHTLKETQYYLAHNHWPTTQQADAVPTSAVPRAVLWAEEHRLLPQAWLYGFLYTYRSTLMRESFLLGHYGNRGWWYYFPLAMLVKTPIATLAAFGVAIVVALRGRLRRAGHPLGWWTAACLGVPLLIYAVSALTSGLNLGIRHILPIYPFVFVLVGIAAARLRAAVPRVFAGVAALLAVGLGVETLAAFPHYLSFFNVASRPYRMTLLSDSNLDWGQDLAYVAEWQQRNPTTRLYLGYFGTMDPAFYGIRYTNIPGGFALNTDKYWPPSEPCAVVFSGTLLQGVNCSPTARTLYEPFRHRKPDEILGDAMFLYYWPLK